MPGFNFTHEALCEVSQLQKARDLIRYWEQRNHAINAPLRDHARSTYNGEPIVARIILHKNQPDEMVTFQACALDLSRSGMSFVVPDELSPLIADDDAKTIRVEKLLQPGDELTLGMLQRDGFRLWLSAEVVILRPTHEQLFQCSVKFTGRKAGLLV